MKLLFVNLSPLKFDVATPDKEPLGGSESSVCYLARQLAENGHDVTLAARLPEGTPAEIRGVKHRPIGVIQDAGFFASEKFATIIISNAPVAAPSLKEISPGSIIILWDHMAPDQPALQNLAAVQTALDTVVYVSPWQQAETEKAFGAAKHATVIGNGLTPSFENLFASPRELLAAKKSRAAYTSTPFRGLRFLLDVMEQRKPDVDVDIFSSMRVYQKADEEYAALYQRARQNPRITYHGAVAQSELAQRLKPASFLAYPCVFPETYCLAALEAMAAGLKVLTTRLGALETTTMGYADLIDIDTSHSDRFVTAFADLMQKNIAAFKETPEAWAEQMFDQVKIVNRTCRWAVRVKEWERLLATLITARLDRTG